MKTRKHLLGLAIAAGAGAMLFGASAQAAVLVGGTPDASNTDLSLWLRADDLNGDGIANNPADGSAVTSWVDSSNSNNDLASGSDKRPTYVSSDAAFNNQPVVHFSSDELFSSSAPTLSDTHTIFIVAQVTDSRKNYNDLLFGYGAADGASTPMSAVIHTDNPGNSGAQYRLDVKEPGGTHSGSKDTTLDDTFVLAIRRDDAGDLDTTTFNVDILLNSSVEAADVTSTGNLPASQEYRIGLLSKNSAQRASEDIAEILIYNRALTDAEVQGVESYLATKYAVPEPASLALLGLGALAMLPRRKRKAAA